MFFSGILHLVATILSRGLIEIAATTLIFAILFLLLSLIMVIRIINYKLPSEGNGSFFDSQYVSAEVADVTLDLYNMEEDPNELHNQVDNPLLKAVRDELLSGHLNWLLSRMNLSSLKDNSRMQWLKK